MNSQWPKLIIFGIIQIVGVCHATNEGDTVCNDSKDCKTSGAPCGPNSNAHFTMCKEIKPGVSCIPGLNACAEDRTFLECEQNKCSCKERETWDGSTSKCYPKDKKDRFDPTRDVIIPSVILMTLAATAWLCFRLFCNCGKTFRRRRRGNDAARVLEEAQIPGIAPSQSTTWVASYRVFGPVSGMDSRSFQPCLLLPAGPPTYDEALKHKVILSSYHPPQMDDSFL